MQRVALLVALLLPGLAAGGGSGLDAVKARYLPAVRAAYPNTPDGAQARYDAGRDLVEAVDRTGSRRRARAAAASRSPRAWQSAGRSGRGARPRRRLPEHGAARTAAGHRPGLRAAPRRRVARRAPRRRRSDCERCRRGLGARARVRSLRGLRAGDALRGRVDREARRARRGLARLTLAGAKPLVVRRSPDSASGRRTSPRTGCYARLGPAAVAEGLRRLGMTSSTFPGPYRATTAVPAAGTAHARDDCARPWPCAPSAPRRRPRR